MIVDTHVHVVSPDPGAYPLEPAGLPGRWYLESPCSAAALLPQMDAARVDRAILVQGVGAYSYDNRYATDSAREHPDRFASAVCVDVHGEDPPGTLTRWAREGGASGVRLFAIGRGAFALDDPNTYPVWERAAELSLHVIVTLLPDQLTALDATLRRFPEVPVSLDHCGFPSLSGPPWRGAEALVALAVHPNLHLKVTTHVIDAAAGEGGEPGAFVRHLVDHFGARRLMWGSDFCQTHDRSYAQLVAAGRQAFADLSDADRDRCLGGTAQALWPALRGEAQAKPSASMST